jgi:hypothetical protein
VIDHYDEMRVAPDPSLAEELRRRLHARMASVPRDDNESRSDLQPDAGGLEPDQQLIPVKENYVSADSPPTSEVRSRRRLAIAAAAVVAVIGIAALAINIRNSDDDVEPLSTAAPTVAPTTAATPTTAAIATTTEPVGVPGALPDGTYRIEVTRSDLDAVNFHSYLFVGLWEWTFLAGRWSYQFPSTSSVVQSTYEGTYNVDEDHITMVIPGQLWNELYQPQEFTWRANPDGSLQFTALASTSGNWAAILASHPLVPTT